MSEKYLGIILWAAEDGSRGVIADAANQTWRFTETLSERNTFNRVSVYEGGWRPKVSQKTNPRTGKPFLIAEPEIVEFEIKFFHFSDGRDGHKITSLGLADDFSQEDYDALSLAREKYEMQKRAERKARYDRREAEPKELGTRTRIYAPR